ncbi:hypothetical protein LZ32DRAFT_221084 [Colletotrichum eremochloae]|nr:hypothetical protein LZ32DRAFT_221084 [Colletotrichum eremochloae]
MVETSSASPDYGDGQIKGPILSSQPTGRYVSQAHQTLVPALAVVQSASSHNYPERCMLIITFPGLSFPIVRKRNGYTDTMDVWLTHLHSLPLSPMARGVAMGNQQAVAKSPFALPILLSLAQGPAPRLGARGEPAANLHFQFWDGSTNARSSMAHVLNLTDLYWSLRLIAHRSSNVNLSSSRIASHDDGFLDVSASAVGWCR